MTNGCESGKRTVRESRIVEDPHCAAAMASDVNVMCPGQILLQELKAEVEAPPTRSHRVVVITTGAVDDHVGTSAPRLGLKCELLNLLG